MSMVQSKKKNSGFRSYTRRIYLIFQSLPWIFEFKNILKLSPEQIQNSGIFRTRDILRTVSIHPVKIQQIRFLIHSKSCSIENLRHIQDTVNLQNTVYTELTIHCNLPFKNLRRIQDPIKYLYNGAFFSEPCVTLTYLELYYYIHHSGMF